MAKEWIMIRVQRSTRLLLERMGQKLASEGGERRKRIVDSSGRHGVTLDAVIHEMLQREDDHATRSARAAQKRKAERRAARIAQQRADMASFGVDQAESQ